MQFKSLLAGVVAAAAMASASAATQNIVFTEYTVSYDDSSSFGGNAGSFWGFQFSGFNWNVPTTVNASGLFADASASFSLPSFTITVNPGYTLSNLSVFLGNIVYNEIDGQGPASTSLTINYEVNVDNGASWWSASTGLLQTETSNSNGGMVRTGYFDLNTGLVGGGFTTVTFSNASIDLAANAAGAVFASVVGQNQNQLRFELNMAPVPESQTYAMLLAGLVALGALAQRRQRG